MTTSIFDDSGLLIPLGLFSGDEGRFSSMLQQRLYWRRRAAVILATARDGLRSGEAVVVQLVAGAEMERPSAMPPLSWWRQTAFFPAASGNMVIGGPHTSSNGCSGGMAGIPATALGVRRLDGGGRPLSWRRAGSRCPCSGATAANTATAVCGGREGRGSAGRFVVALFVPHSLWLCSNTAAM